MKQTDRHYTEKRDFIRMRLGAKVILQHAGENIEALCHDLSSTGMRLEANCQLQVGDRVTVLIVSSHQEITDLLSEAQVVRVTEAGNGRLMLGLTVLSMS
jgi:hypothetical protein